MFFFPSNSYYQRVILVAVLNLANVPKYSIGILCDYVLFVQCHLQIKPLISLCSGCSAVSKCLIRNAFVHSPNIKWMHQTNETI